MENYKKEKSNRVEDQETIETPIKRTDESVESPKKKVKSKGSKGEELKVDAPIGMVVEQEILSTHKMEAKAPIVTEEPKSESPKKKKKHIESLDSDATEKKKLKKKKKESELSQQ